LVRYVVIGRRWHVDAATQQTSFKHGRALKHFGVHFTAGQFVVSVTRHIALVDRLI
jgi:hypothetical protein